MKDKKFYLGVFLSFLSAAGFGAAAPVAKAVFASGVGQFLMLTGRFTIASILLWVYIYIKRDKIDFKIKDKRQLITYLSLGIVYFITTNLYYKAIQIISVSLHVVIFYTYPFIVSIMSVVFLKDKIDRKSVVAMLVAFSGILLMVFDGNNNFITAGIVLSFSSAFGYGVYMTILGVDSIKSARTVVIAAYANSITAIAFLIATFMRGELTLNLNSTAWAGIVFLATISTMVAIVALAAAIKLIGPSKVSIVSTFEPVEGILLSVLFLGETLVQSQIIGTIMVLFAILVISVKKKKFGGKL
ncbi:MAG: EamA family transporter [Clostridiales bacterium]|nr:EamA family transporter [Clostridiales bacterium]